MDARLRRRAALLLSGALVLLLGHAFIPLSEFIHRGDDAFYYFGIAANYPKTGMWTFDGVVPTNGVQPLWAILLSAIAQVLAWFGLEDRHVLSRVFVAVTALAHFGSVALLFRLLSRRVSTGTAIAAAGALLFPLGLVWAHVWGMENSLYALVLIGTVTYYDTSLRERPAGRSALILGGLLGLTALARLNAGLLTPVLLVAMLMEKRLGVPRRRIQLATLTGAAASMVVIPYLAFNLATTGHLLPISGAVKAVGVEQVFRAEGIDSVLSFRFLQFLYWDNFRHVVWFITSRALDGLWAVGARLFFPGATSLRTLAVVVVALLAIPLALGRPREWLALLRARFRAVGAFWYVGAFGAVDAVTSVIMYPTQLSYGMTRWWLVENELVVIVLAATLAAAVVGYVGSRLLARRWHVRAVTAILAVALVYHAHQFVRFYWDGEKQNLDWNLSWNDESYRAAVWMSESLPADAIVGSWNAGVVGYYSEQTVINLDGLINNFELLPYLRDADVARYVRERGIEYLADLNPMFERTDVSSDLALDRVYSHHSDFMRTDYRVERVEGPRTRSGGVEQ